MIVGYLLGILEVPTTILLMELTLKGSKMEKADKEKLMSEIWKQYNDTKDVEFLAKACEEAPFFGQKKMALKIDRILRAVKKKQ